MSPQDARVLIVATLIIAGVPVAMHEYRMHSHHQGPAHSAEGQEGQAGWSSASGGRSERIERNGAPDSRPAR